MNEFTEMLCTVTGKIMYASPKAAMQASIEFKRRKQRSAKSRKFKSEDPALHHYFCSHCEAYHIGHATGRENTQKGKRQLASAWRKHGR